mmetsp:Transcript_5864/g.16537  ORF Transcript_5864/g.16537 Transcript_5864/m.16537 type:complete len:402 (+) Transcript_5864:1380-2585(+)
MASRSASPSSPSIPWSLPCESCQARGEAKRQATRGVAVDRGDSIDGTVLGEPAVHDAARRCIRSPSERTIAGDDFIGTCGGGGGGFSFSGMGAGCTGNRAADLARALLSSLEMASASSRWTWLPSLSRTKVKPFKRSPEASAYASSPARSLSPLRISRAASGWRRQPSRSKSSSAPFAATRFSAVASEARAPNPQGGPNELCLRDKLRKEGAGDRSPNALSKRAAGRGPSEFAASDKVRSVPRHKTQPLLGGTSRSSSCFPIRASSVALAGPNELAPKSSACMGESSRSSARTNAAAVASPSRLPCRSNAMRHRNLVEDSLTQAPTYKAKDAKSSGCRWSWPRTANKDGAGPAMDMLLSLNAARLLSSAVRSNIPRIWRPSLPRARSSVTLSTDKGRAPTR